MINDSTKTNDDLKAFERRLIEIISHYEPPTKRWRVILMTAIIATTITTYNFLADPRITETSIIELLGYHKYFTTNLIILILLLITGIHQKIVAPRIIVKRIRKVLRNYNMSCNQSGRLIIKRPTINKFILENNNNI